MHVYMGMAGLVPIFHSHIPFLVASVHSMARLMCSVLLVLCAVKLIPNFTVINMLVSLMCLKENDHSLYLDPEERIG